MLIRLDGAGFSHGLLEHIASGGGVRGRNWEFSVGWSCTDKEMDAIGKLPEAAWTGGICQDGEPAEDTFVADLTGLLDLGAWQEKVPGLRIIVRDEPLHPRYRKRATEREKKLGRRYQLIATSTRQGQISWLDARHRSHVHVENNVKQAKDLGRVSTEAGTVHGRPYRHGESGGGGAAAGRTLLASGGDGTVRLWDPATGIPAAVVRLAVPDHSLTTTNSQTVVGGRSLT